MNDGIQVYEGKGDGPAPHDLACECAFWRDLRVLEVHSSARRLEFLNLTGTSRKVLERLVMGTYISLRIEVLGVSMMMVENRKLVGRIPGDDHFNLLFAEKDDGE